VYNLSVSVVRNSYTYTVLVRGQGVTTSTVTYTSTGAATDGEIAAGLVSALNGVVGKNFTAAGAASPVTVTGDAAGNWFTLELLNLDDLAIEQVHVDPGVADDLTAIKAENDKWYVVYTVYNSRAYSTAVAAYVQGVKRLYLCDSNTTKSATLSVGSGNDLLHDLFTLGHSRTVSLFHHALWSMPGAGWLGRVLPTTPGSITWMYKSASGVPTSNLTDTHVVNLSARFANYYVDVNGARLFAEGWTTDGGYADVTRSLDFSESDMSTRLFNTLNTTDKVPFTDEGGVVLEADVQASLQAMVDAGVYAANPAPRVVMPLVANISLADKAARVFPDIKFFATLQGAVHKVIPVNGTVSL
jgi:hypothetical protein